MCTPTLGQAGRAFRDLDIAERLYTQLGQDLEAAMTIQNRADVAVQAGDLPAALTHLDEAASRYAALGYVSSDLVFDRCKVLLAAGLAAEALAEADAGITRLAGRSADKAELLFAAARAAQAAGRPSDAAVRATAARNLFRAQHREWWSARAAFVLVQSRYDAGRRDGRTRLAADRIADRLDDLGAEEAPAAHLLAGRLAAATGRPGEADRHLARAARLRHQGPTYGQAAGWLAQALRADGRGATAAALHACRRGLLAAAEHQQRLGAVELRVHAAAYGTELAAIGQRHAVRRGDPRMLLTWSERWRAGALASPSARPPDDGELAADLAALRTVMSRLDAAKAARSPTDRLEQDRRRLEAAIRARTRRTAAGDRPATVRTGAEQTLDRLDDHLLVELVALDDTLYAVTARPGRIRLHVVGPVADAVREVELTRFMLRRLARGRPPPGTLPRLAIAGRQLEAALLGPAAAEIGTRAVVIVPPGRLHSVPWGMVPCLQQVPWTVAPSAATWAQARQRPMPRRRREVIVVGPGLPGTLAEITRIADGYAAPMVLSGGRATAPRVLAAVDGASTAHIAAHGVFRGDNPLFSSLRLDDGPLTIYDLGRLRRAPHRMILSSCESGVAAAVAGDELLGMISVLIPLGTASLLASMVPVNDAASAPFMVDFHTGLRSGATFGDALHAGPVAGGRRSGHCRDVVRLRRPRPLKRSYRDPGGGDLRTVGAPAAQPDRSRVDVVDDEAAHRVDLDPLAPGRGLQVVLVAGRPGELAEQADPVAAVVHFHVHLDPAAEEGQQPPALRRLQVGADRLEGGSRHRPGRGSRRSGRPERRRGRGPGTRPGRRRSPRRAVRPPPTRPAAGRRAAHHGVSPSITLRLGRFWCAVRLGVAEDHHVFGEQQIAQALEAPLPGGADAAHRDVQGRGHLGVRRCRVGHQHP